MITNKSRKNQVRFQKKQSSKTPFFSEEKETAYFDSKSIIRRVYREGVILLGGGSSILMQLAHPFVAAGVADHSNFQDEILNRLYRTLLFIQNLIFADKRQTQRALKQFHAMHKNISGYLKHDSGRFPAGTSYSGRDPGAMLWVHATFVDTVLKVYQLFVKPLTEEEQQSYYLDTVLLARLMQIPEKLIPENKTDFDIYMNKMISGNTIAITPTAKRLAREVLYPRVGFLPKLSAMLLRFVSAGILPGRLRTEFGLKWGPQQQYVLNALSSIIRILRPVVPACIWQNPLMKGKFTYFLIWGNRPVRQALKL